MKKTYEFIVLNVLRQFEDITSDGRLFQIFAAATGNATAIQNYLI